MIFIASLLLVGQPTDVPPKFVIDRTLKCVGTDDAGAPVQLQMSIKGTEDSAVIDLVPLSGSTWPATKATMSKVDGIVNIGKNGDKFYWGNSQLMSNGVSYEFGFEVPTDPKGVGRSAIRFGKTLSPPPTIYREPYIRTIGCVTVGSANTGVAA